MRRRTRFRLLFNAAVIACFIVVVFGGSGLTQGEIVARHALEHLDAPYVFGTAGPDRFDCSGLVLHCLKRDGIRLPHSAKDIGSDERYRQITDVRALLPGDLVCFDTVRDRDPYDHIGFYLGGGQFVHASSSKGKVIVSDLADYYLDKFTGARRVAQVWF